MLNVVPIELEPGADGRFYVYLYRDSRAGREGVPIYVGKGTQNLKYGEFARARFHWEKRASGAGNRGSRLLQEVLRDIERAALVPVVEIVGRFAEERRAFECEEELIGRYGRRDLNLGTLCNVSDGGEGPIGFRHTDEALRKIGDASRLMHADQAFAARRAAKISTALNRPATKAARSAIMKEVHSRPGDKERRTAAQRAAFSTVESRALRIITTKEAHARPETKARHSAGLARRWAADGAKEKHSAAMRALYDDPSHKKRQADGVKAWLASPEYAAKKAIRGKITIDCAGCSRPFPVYRSRVAHGRGKFCSPACQYAARRPAAPNFLTCSAGQGA